MLESAADFAIDLTPVERLLLRTPVLALGEFHCPLDDPQFRGGGPQACAYVVFPRTPVRISPQRGRPEICTPAIACYYNIGDSYERHAVAGHDDRCDWIAVSPALLRELNACTGSACPADFAGAFAPIASADLLAQRQLFNRLAVGPTLSALQAEEAVIALLQRMLATANDYWRHGAGSAPFPPRPTDHRRWRSVDQAKQLLAAEYRQNLTLAELAQRVNCSPGHLARSFRAVTGSSLHGYRNQLRLRHALPLLPDFKHNLSGLALDFGFASHSHFSDAFRRHFGMTPSDCHQHASRRAEYADIDRSPAPPNRAGI